MRNKRHVAVCVFAVSLLLLAGASFLPIPESAVLSAARVTFLRASLVRLFGFSAVAALVAFVGYRPLARPHNARLWVPVTLAALLVAVNNLPVSALASGRASLSGDALDVALFAVMCVAIGLFEEWLFRGLILGVFLEKWLDRRRGVFASVLLSSALFALSHLLNLGEQGVAATLLQVGYTFLVGCMAAVVYLAAGNLLFPVAIHAIYDFCGKLLPFLGTGDYGMDTVTVAVTAALAALTAGYYGAVLARLPYENGAALLPAAQEKNNRPAADERKDS